MRLMMLVAVCLACAGCETGEVGSGSSSLLVELNINIGIPGGFEMHTSVPDGRGTTTVGAVRDLPHREVIIYEGGELNPVEIEARFIGDDGRLRSLLRARTRFVANEDRRLALEFTNPCLDVICEGGATCIAGSCASSEVFEDELLPLEPAP